MRPIVKLLLVLNAICYSLFAYEVWAGSIQVDPAKRVEFTDCSSSGSSATAITAGTYLMRVTDSDVFVCYFNNSTSTCGSGGEKFPQGFAAVVRIGLETTHIRCRSSASIGDVVFTAARVEKD